MKSSSQDYCDADQLQSAVSSPERFSQPFIPPTNFEIPTIDVKVIEHYQVGDGATFDKHYFVIKVRVENLSFNVDRSYVDFVDLDRRLRKKFPRTDITTLPLDQSVLVEKAFLDRRRSAGISGSLSVSAVPGNGGSFSHSLQASNRDSFSFRESIIQPSFSSNKSLRVKDFDEDIYLKVEAVDSYMVSLLSLHEVVVSDEIMLFLDEEASSMAVDPESLLPITVHDLLLMNEPINKRNVSRLQEHTFQVRPGQFVVWKFSTIKYDIGFSVELNGESKIAFTRYKSHESAICGAFEANQSAICKLKWDNSYAKCNILTLFCTFSRSFLMNMNIVFYYCVYLI
jgi:hypothetical protein